MTDTLNEARRWEVEDAARAGAEWLDGYAAVLQAAATDALRYRRNYDDAATSEARTQILSWAVNHATGVLPNVRLDLAVTGAVRLTKAHAGVPDDAGHAG